MTKVHLSNASEQSIVIRYELHRHILNIIQPVTKLLQATASALAHSTQAVPPGPSTISILRQPLIARIMSSHTRSWPHPFIDSRQALPSRNLQAAPYYIDPPLVANKASWSSAGTWSSSVASSEETPSGSPIQQIETAMAYVGNSPVVFREVS